MCDNNQNINFVERESTIPYTNRINHKILPAAEKQSKPTVPIESHLAEENKLLLTCVLTVSGLL